MALNMKEYAIGYLAQRTGLAVSAIRHYESQGLSNPTAPHLGNAGLRARTFGVCRLSRLPKVLVSACPISAIYWPDCRTTAPRQGLIGPVFQKILKAF